jgi:hypothetical protein
MNMNMKVTTAILAVVMTATCGAFAQGELIVDGNFASDAAWTEREIVATEGSQTITYTGSGVHIVDDGDRFNLTIFQEIAVVADTTYVLSGTYTTPTALVGHWIEVIATDTFVEGDWPGPASVTKDEYVAWGNGFSTTDGPYNETFGIEVTPTTDTLYVGLKCGLWGGTAGMDVTYSDFSLVEGNLGGGEGEGEGEGAGGGGVGHDLSWFCWTDPDPDPNLTITTVTDDTAVPESDSCQRFDLVPGGSGRSQVYLCVTGDASGMNYVNFYMKTLEGDPNEAGWVIAAASASWAGWAEYSSTSDAPLVGEGWKLMSVALADFWDNGSTDWGDITDLMIGLQPPSSNLSVLIDDLNFSVDEGGDGNEGEGEGAGGGDGGTAITGPLFAEIDSAITLTAPASGTGYAWSLDGEPAFHETADVILPLDSNTICWHDGDEPIVSVSTDTPGPQSPGALRFEITAGQNVRPYFCTDWADYSSNSYVNLYMKVVEGDLNAAGWGVAFVLNDWWAMYYASATAPAAGSGWQYISIPMSNFNSWWGDTPPWSSVSFAQLYFDPSASDVIVEVDHVTFSETPANVLTLDPVSMEHNGTWAVTYDDGTGAKAPVTLYHTLIVGAAVPLGGLVGLGLLAGACALCGASVIRRKR